LLFIPLKVSSPAPEEIPEYDKQEDYNTNGHVSNDDDFTIDSKVVCLAIVGGDPYNS
jgi:hypothetical protein